MADKGLSITPCNNAAIRQAARMLGQLYDDALAPSGLRATQHTLLKTVRRIIPRRCAIRQPRWSWIFRRWDIP